MTEERKYILYDSRACGGDTDDAAILVVCDDDKEAREATALFDYDVACFSYAVEGTDQLVDERVEWNWFDSDGFSDEGHPEA